MIAIPTFDGYQAAIICFNLKLSNSGQVRRE
jgi:hypothetical protein